MGDIEACYIYCVQEFSERLPPVTRVLRFGLDLPHVSLRFTRGYKYPAAPQLFYGFDTATYARASAFGRDHPGHNGCRYPFHHLNTDPILIGNITAIGKHGSFWQKWRNLTPFFEAIVPFAAYLVSF